MIGPLRGDVRLCNPERDEGKPQREVTDFEIWDGTRWVHARDADKIVYLVELST